MNILVQHGVVISHFQTHASDFLSGLVPFNDIHPLVAFAREKYAPFHWSINLSKKWWGKETYHGNLYQKGFRKHPSHPPLVVNLTYLYCDSYEARCLHISDASASVHVYFSKPKGEPSEEVEGKPNGILATLRQHQ